MSLDSFEQRFPFGTHYYCPPTPLPAEWDGDMADLASAGYTHVQFRVLWRWYERQRGQFAWDELDQIFDCALKHGLRVVLKPMLENAPDWVFTDLQGGRIGFHGQPLTRFAMNSAYYAGGYMPCFDNPAVVMAARVFVEALVERYREHEALWYYDAWNEPRSRPLGQCLCEHSQASYRHWLQDRYGDIQSLNRALYKSWSSYDGVIPPASSADVVEMYLWRTWAAWAVSEHVAMVSHSIRKMDSTARIVVHAGSPSVVQDPACDASDDLLNRQSVDRYGSSMSVVHAPASPLEYAQTEFASSWLRRVDPDYWCHEFYPIGADWPTPSPEAQLKQRLWMALGGGAGAMTFWEYRSVRMGVRSNGFGLRGIDASQTSQGRVCDEVASVVRKHGQVLTASSRPRSDVAMLYSRESDVVFRIFHMKNFLGNIETETPNVDYVYKRALHGAHACHLLNGIQPDWVIPGDDFSAYRLVHVTCAEMVDASLAQQLRDYVRQGGTLVVEYPFACRDEKTWITLKRPHHDLVDLLGCVESERLTVLPAQTHTATFENDLKLTVDATSQGWRIDLDPQGQDAKVIGRWADGKTAAVHHHLGKGQVFVLGVSPALTFADRFDDPATTLYRWIQDCAGLETQRLQGASQQVWISRRMTKEAEIWFVFNVSDQPQQINLPCPPKVQWDAKETQTHTPESFILQKHGTLVLQMPLGCMLDKGISPQQNILISGD